MDEIVQPQMDGDKCGWMGVVQLQMDAEGWVLYEAGSCLVGSGAFTLHCVIVMLGIRPSKLC